MKNIASFVVALVAVLFIVSCVQPTILTVSQSALSFDNKGGNQSVTITANKLWSISSNQSWLRVSPPSGEGNASISVSCEANTTYDSRTGTITITSEELTQTISVTQAEGKGLIVSQTEYNLTNEAQTISVEVQANVQYTVSIDDACKSWITQESTKGLSSNTIKFAISKNESYDGREGKITVKQTDGSLSGTVVVKQSQQNGLFVTTSEYNLSNEEHTLTVEVKANVEFDVKSNADWIKYVETKGLKTSQIILSVSANETYDAREGKVVVKQMNGDLSGTITVKQDERIGLFVSPEKIDVSNQATVVEVEVKQNVAYDVVIPADAKSWITVVKTKGLQDDKVSLAIDENASYVERKAVVTVKQRNGDLCGTVKIAQAQTDYLSISSMEDTIPSKSNKYQLSVVTNVPYSLKLAKDADWLSLGTSSRGETVDGLTTYLHSFSVCDNFSTSFREVVFFVEAEESTLSDRFSLIQEADVIISFADALTKQICVNKWDLTGDGELSTLEASKVTRLEKDFQYTDIQSFNELKYFTGLTWLNDPFLECRFLKEITLPNELERIIGGAFKGCDALTDIVIPSNVKVVEGYDLFSGCSGLKSVSLPPELKRMGSNMFKDCSSLASIDIPSSVTEIGGGAFSGCSGLTSIVIPFGVTVFWGGVFEGCRQLLDIVIPSSVTVIGAGAFANCSSLTSIDIPSSVTKIEHGAFSGCSSLTSIVIPSGVTIIDMGVFGNCSSLRSIIIPELVTSISSGAFSGCSSLQEVIISERVKNIGYEAFMNCSSLTSITIPSRVNSIDNKAFAYCKNLLKVNILATVPPEIGEGCWPSSDLSFFVPKESVDAYKSEPSWKIYAERIYAIE